MQKAFTSQPWAWHLTKDAVWKWVIYSHMCNMHAICVCVFWSIFKHPKSPFFWGTRTESTAWDPPQGVATFHSPSCNPKSTKPASVAIWVANRNPKKLQTDESKERHVYHCSSCFLNFVKRKRKIARQHCSPTRRIYALTNLIEKEKGNLEIQLEHTGCTLRTRISWITRRRLTRKSEKKKTDSKECQTSGKPLN